MLKRVLTIMVLVVGMLTLGCADKNTSANSAVETKKTMAVFETSTGTFTVELFKDKAPNTVNNFVTLANKGFYNNLIFHRVIPDFMIQGGDPTGTGRGGPGYVIKDEFHKDLKHDKQGILSMANAGPNSGGSQFFITVKETPWLDGRHAVFGQVVEGMDVVHKISKVSRNMQDKPLRDVTIISVKIQEK